MKLYHGTSESRAKKALKQGLKPRSLTGCKGNWQHTIDSHPGMVYLTSTYAPYYGAATSKIGRNGKYKERMAILEIDTDRLDPNRLMPDEDFLFVALKNHDLTREAIRDSLDVFQRHWKDSLNYLGTVGYMGVIPPEAITRVTFFDLDSNPAMAVRCLDPSISPINFKFCGHQHRALTRWFFGDPVKPEEVFDFAFNLAKQNGDDLGKFDEALAMGARETLVLDKPALHSA